MILVLGVGAAGIRIPAPATLKNHDPVETWNCDRPFRGKSGLGAFMRRQERGRDFGDRSPATNLATGQWRFVSVACTLATRQTSPA